MKPISFDHINLVSLSEKRDVCGCINRLLIIQRMSLARGMKSVYTRILVPICLHVFFWWCVAYPNTHLRLYNNV